MFNEDRMLGIVLGEGRGHAFFSAPALDDVLGLIPPSAIRGYEDLVQDLANQGYNQGRISHIWFE